MTTRVAVLVSGSGTNLQALLDAQRAKTLGAEVCVVLSNKPDVRALSRAKEHGVEALVLEHGAFETRAAFERAMVGALLSRGVELVVLAGFMRLLTREFLDAFPSRVVNVHPSLLPAFPGVEAQAQALAWGVKVAGCTVHFVDAGTDTGPIITQRAVPVLDGDTVETLRARILEQEHLALPEVVRALAEGRVRVEGRRVFVAPP